ncbi:MAG TPA: tetratricopeptide repeat protein [Longimicrobiales bacterium]|nr:tetratricopeptide repeat protein [Longimicrobiales bacterium]
MAFSFKARQLATGVVLLGAVMASATPALAQEGGRMRVLIPAFVNAEGKIFRTGERVADQLRRQVNGMPTHAPADMKDAEAQMKKFGVKMADMTCITWKQLASQMNGVGLVLCGTIDEASNQVTATFEPVGGGADPFKVQPFALQSPEQGAQQIVQAFGTYVRGLQLAQNCRDFIDNQSWQQALDNCNQAIEINPASVGATYSRGTALLNMDRPEEAFDTYKKVLELDPLNQEAMMAAGYTAARLGQQDVALGYFHQYLELNPDAEQVRLTIATRLAQEGDPAAALKLLEEATTKPDAGRTVILYAGHFAMNAALMRQQAGPASGNTDESTALMQQALTHYERVMQMAPDSADALLLRQMMLAYRGTGNTEKALEIGQRATSAPDVEAQTWAVYSDVLKEAGRIDEAVAALDRAASIDPNMSGLALRKGVMLLDQNRLNDAVAAFKQAQAKGELQDATAEQLAQQMALKGYQQTQASRFEASMPFYAAARELGKSERTIAMINFFHGFTLIKQGEPIVKEGNNAAAARRAKPLFDRAKALLESAGAYTEQASTRATLIAQTNQFLEVIDALIRAGR